MTIDRQGEQEFIAQTPPGFWGFLGALGLHVLIALLLFVGTANVFVSDPRPPAEVVVRLISPSVPEARPRAERRPMALPDAPPAAEPANPPLLGPEVVDVEPEATDDKAASAQDTDPPLPEPQAPPPLTAALPASGEIRMQAYLGRYQLDSEPLGVGSLSVVFPQEDRYEIRLTAEAKGWAALLVRDAVRFYSQGRLTVDGLVPERFESQTPFRGQVLSTFDLLTGQAQLAPQLAPVALPEAFQDRLSVIFQLAWIGQTRPGALEYGARHTLTVAGSREFRAATFTVEGRDDLVLPGGIVLSAIRLVSDTVSGRREGQIEVWLDPSDRYLPARMLFRETNGQSVDFLAIRAVF